MSSLPSSGQQFGPFTVVDVLGRGGMGITYTASQPRLDRTVALKVLDPRLADSEDYRARFAHEAAVLSRLDSPHIIQVYDYGEHEGRLFLATQLVRGGDLAARLKGTGAMSYADALALCEQLAEALEDAHRAGIIHRDIKPGNVLLREGSSPYAYLCDFGIAQSADTGSTSTGTVIGTWAYLAPERCHGAPASPASDIYALGCVLWAMLQGTAPYAGTDVAVAMAHVNDPLPQLPADSAAAVALNQVLARAMAKSPEDRYASAQQMRAEVARVRAGLADGSIGVGNRPVEETVLRPVSAAAVPLSGATSGPPADATVLRPRGTRPETQVRGAAAYSPVVPPVAAPPPGRNPKGLMAMAVGLAVLLVVVLGLGAVALLRERGDSAAASSSTGDRSAAASAEAAGGKRSAPLVDYDGDGRSDVAAQTFDTGEVFGMLSGEGGFAPASVWASGLGTPETPHRVNGDFDGDGRTDMVTLDEAGGALAVRFWRSSGQSFEDARQWASLPVVDPTNVNLLTGDYDDDGRSDLALIYYADQGPRVEVLRSTGKGFAAATVWAERLPVVYDQNTMLSGDFDGDGSSDLVYVQSYDGGLPVWVARSTGKGFAAPVQWGEVPGASYDQSKLAIGDFDEDGLDDVTVLLPTTGDRTVEGVRMLMLRSTKKRFDTPRSWGEEPGWKLGESWVSAGDFDGDGRADVARMGPGRDGIDLWTLSSQGKEFAAPVAQSRVDGESFWQVRTLHTKG